MEEQYLQPQFKAVKPLSGSCRHWKTLLIVGQLSYTEVRGDMWEGIPVLEITTVYEMITSISYQYNLEHSVNLRVANCRNTEVGVSK